MTSVHFFLCFSSETFCIPITVQPIKCWNTSLLSILRNTARVSIFHIIYLSIAFYLSFCAFFCHRFLLFFTFRRKFFIYLSSMFLLCFIFLFIAKILFIPSLIFLSVLFYFGVGKYMKYICIHCRTQDPICFNHWINFFRHSTMSYLGLLDRERPWYSLKHVSNESSFSGVHDVIIICTFTVTLS